MFDTLDAFVRTKMRMSHIYQPVVLRELLRRDGRAQGADLARALLAEDRSQVEYYEKIVQGMVGVVLKRHGLVRQEGPTYSLLGGALDDAERDQLTALCDAKIAEYIEQRRDPWLHRRKAEGYISGTIRYDVLKQAKFRCELCGISADLKALEVDHILPRNRGGTDERFNLQCLCYSCNAMKRDRDDTKFTGTTELYDARCAGCVFCDMPLDRIVAQNALAVAIRDAYPVTPLHTLVIPRRHVASTFDLFQPERNAINQLLDTEREAIRTLDKDVAGFNIGANEGESAGQTVMHCHWHLIPRRTGDVTNPRGGVRGVIPAKQSY